MKRNPKRIDVDRMNCNFDAIIALLRSLEHFDDANELDKRRKIIVNSIEKEYE